MPPKRAPATAPAKKMGKNAPAPKVKGKKSVAEPPPLESIDGREVWLATDALEKAKTMRNYFQMEKDRIVAFWDITKDQIDEIKEKLRMKAQEKGELEDHQEIEKKVFKQKIRHLLYENQLHLSTLKEEAERAYIAKGDEYREKEIYALRDVRDISQGKEREFEILHREQNLRLVAEQDKFISEQQSQFEREIKEMHLKFEQQMKSLREDMDKQRREEISHIEKRKDQHVKELTEVHERTFKEIKDYYCEITSNNLEMIRTLKDEVYARKRTEAHNEKAMFEVAQRNKKLTEPLAKLQRQKKDLEQDLASYIADKETLLHLKADVRATDQEYQTLSWEHEVLLQRFVKLKEDKDIILNKYNNMLQEIQKKSTFRRVLVQKKIELVQGQLEGRDARLTELLKRANINAEDLKGFQQKVHDLLSEKDKTIEDLKSLILNMTDRGQDIISTYHAYLENNGISVAGVHS